MNDEQDFPNSYKEQLKHVELALHSAKEGPEKEELLKLKANIQELLALLVDGTDDTNKKESSIEDEYALFMSEINSENATKVENYRDQCIPIHMKHVEGMKCRAPFKHELGNTIYHNAMISSICSMNEADDVIKVKVLFINPTHQNMLPCPYFLGSNCKFSDDKCRFSHGELVDYEHLKEYVEPKFDHLTKGSRVLAKKSDNLWYRASIRYIYDDKCFVQFESNHNGVELMLEHVWPLPEEADDSENDCSTDSEREERNEDVINMSLMITPCSQSLGEWEKFTKGMGSKMMEKMGYITGTGLGKGCSGIIEPVSAVILPSGKSLDYCMNLRENAGGDKNFFSAERKLKRLQKKQELKSQRNYEANKKNVNIFTFINKTLLESAKHETTKTVLSKTTVKNETNHNLNVASFRTDENIKRIEIDLRKIKESLKRNANINSEIFKKLQTQLKTKETELQELKSLNVTITSEKQRRNDKRKMVEF